jgi:hypothetical protein
MPGVDCRPSACHFNGEEDILFLKSHRALAREEVAGTGSVEVPFPEF